MLTVTGTTSHRDKREVTSIVLGITVLVAALAEISYGVIANRVTTKSLTKVVEDTSDQVGLAIKDMQRSLSSLACMVIDHHLALDFLLAKQGGVCAIANTSCCTYINTSGIVEERADYILQQAKWLQEQSLKNSGFYTGVRPNKILAPLQDLVPTLSGAYSCHYSLACVRALHFKLTCQVCFFLPRIHRTTNASGGDENDLLLQSP
jgi:hypothetical protein